MKYIKLVTFMIAGSLVTSSAHAEDALAKDASSHTKAHQQQLKKQLPFADDKDFALAEQGLIYRPESVEIKNAQGKVVWELGEYDYLSADNAYHDTINPSLERQARLNMHYGLFKVADRIYQVRGYDLANMTVIQGDTGWIIFDTLLTAPTAKAALKLVNDQLGERPVKAVVYSHAHADHFGGVRGIVSDEQVASGQVQIIAPRGFMEHAIKENVLAGNAMTRRAAYQYGNVLPKGPKGLVDAAIGKGLSNGFIGLIAPTKVIEKDEETIVVDGITMVMQNTPNTESPSEMNTYFPQFKALWAAENVIGTLHNVYTLRGAQVRDALGWSKYINKLIHGYAKDANVLFASHSWPRWGNEYLTEVLENQRDMYGYLHDHALHLANQGVTINEIHNEFEVPESLAQQWYNRGYHGSVSHNVRGVLNKYLGFFDMNPATLNQHSPTDQGKRYVAAIGGADKVIKIAQAAYQEGDYRWSAELLNHLVFAQPNNKAAKLLLADSFEQMGYQAESAGWRNTYLTGASELRHGLATSIDTAKAGPDMVRAMSSELVFDYLGVLLDSKQAVGKKLDININFSDTDEQFLLQLKNSHLNNIAGINSDHANVTITMKRSDLNLMLMKQKGLKELISSGAIKHEGDLSAFVAIFKMTTEFSYWFNIVTP